MFLFLDGGSFRHVGRVRELWAQRPEQFFAANDLKDGGWQRAIFLLAVMKGLSRSEWLTFGRVHHTI